MFGSELAGRVRSLRRRFLNDSVEDAVMPRTFWRGIKFYAAKDTRGRDVLRMCTWLPKDADNSFISKCVFYLRRADINVVWPSAFPAETVLELVTSEPVAATEVPKHTEAAPAAESLKPAEPELTEPLKLVETTPITDQAAQLQKAKRAGRPSSKKLVLLKVEERALEHRRRLAGGEPPCRRPTGCLKNATCF